MPEVAGASVRVRSRKVCALIAMRSSENHHHGLSAVLFRPAAWKWARASSFEPGKIFCAESFLDSVQH
jgi:hypothetical protein